MSEQIRRRRKNHHKKYGAVHRRAAAIRAASVPGQPGEVVPVTAKCPTCGAMHEVELAPDEIEPGIIQRIYCKRHEHNRTFDGIIYGMAGSKTTRAPRRGAQA